MATRTTQGQEEPTAAIVKFQLPAPVQSTTPQNSLKAENILNGIIVLRGTGRLIQAALGPCRPILFQFVDNYEQQGPIPLTVGHEQFGPYAIVDTQAEQAGIWQFLSSESSPAMRVARDATAMLKDNKLYGVTAVLRAQASKANPGMSYYVFEPPEVEDVSAEAQFGVPL